MTLTEIGSTFVLMLEGTKMKQDLATSRVETKGSRASDHRHALNQPLVGLVGSDLSRRFLHWRGVSGRRYLFSIFPLSRTASIDEAPRFDDAVILAVMRDAAGERRILVADESGALPDLFYASAQLRDAVAAGANEIHVHLLTDDVSARAAVLRDLDGAF